MLGATSCKKQTADSGKNGTTAAPPLMYEVLDKNGKSILDTANLLSDSLTLSWSGNEVSNQFFDKMLNLNFLPESASSSALLAAYKKYNGIAAVDYTMVQLSVGVASPYPAALITPVHTFTLSYHGENLGTIYFEYGAQHATWQQAKTFTFNNAAVPIDTTGGKHLYVIQLQQ